MTCLYCENENVVLAGRASAEELEQMCAPHRRRHEQMAGVFRRMVPEAFAREPRWRYFEHQGWRYCWSTERMPDGKFAAFIYQPDGDDLLLVKELRFAMRKTAKAKALGWYQRAKQTASGRLPASALR